MTAGPRRPARAPTAGAADACASYRARWGAPADDALERLFGVGGQADEDEGDGDDGATHVCVLCRVRVESATELVAHIARGCRRDG